MELFDPEFIFDDPAFPSPSPAHGFYVIVPPECRQLGCLPAGQFIPALMEQLGLGYYVGLLSAAQSHDKTQDAAVRGRHQRAGPPQWR